MKFPRPIDSWYAPHQENHTYTAYAIRARLMAEKLNQVLLPLLNPLREMVEIGRQIMNDFCESWEQLFLP